MSNLLDALLFNNPGDRWKAISQILETLLPNIQVIDEPQYIIKWPIEKWDPNSRKAVSKVLISLTGLPFKAVPENLEGKGGSIPRYTQEPTDLQSL